MSIENWNPPPFEMAAATVSEPIMLFPSSLQSMREHLDAMRAMQGGTTAATDSPEPKPTNEAPPHGPREAPAQAGEAAQVGGRAPRADQPPPAAPRADQPAPAAPPADRARPPQNDVPRDGGGGRFVVDTAYRSNKIFQTIVKESNFGDANLQNAFRRVFQDELANNPGQDPTEVLQRLVDQTNRRFEDNNRDGMIARNNLGPHAPSQYYLGVQDANTIILYSPDGIRTLNLRPR